MVRLWQRSRRWCAAGGVHESERVAVSTHKSEGMAVSQLGQASMEYALVTLAFMSMLTALALLWHAGRDGSLLQRAVEAGSHLWEGGDVLGAMRDVALF